MSRSDYGSEFGFIFESRSGADTDSVEPGLRYNTKYVTKTADGRQF